MCGSCVVVCEDFEIFQRSPVWGRLCVAVCREFENFQSYPVHVLGGVLCGDFMNFQFCFVCGLCVVVCGDFEFFQKISSYCYRPCSFVLCWYKSLLKI